MKKMIITLQMATANQGRRTQNCWECMNCPEESRKNCTAYYLEGGEDCWFFNDVSVGGPRKKEHIGCLDCPIYKKKLEYYAILKKS